MTQKSLKSLNPRTGEVIDTIELMSTSDIENAVEAAAQAGKIWREVPVEERVKRLLGARDFILAHLDEIAELISLEQGKPLAEAMSADILPAVQLFNQFGPKMRQMTATERIPMQVLIGIKSSKIHWKPLGGPVAVITPWNFPFSIPLSGIVFALMAGNSVLFKPASEVPLLGKMIARCFTEGADLPEGLFQLLLAAGRDVGSTLFKPPVRKVVFTGSTDTGKWIMRECSKHLIPTVLELGGKDAMIVLEDADLELAVKGALWGAFGNCGQVCASVERLYVARPLFETFVARLKVAVEELRMGYPGVEEYDVGPLNNEAQRAVVEAHVEEAVARGATVVTGGRRPEGQNGFFFPPTVLVNVDHSMQVMRDETFGPLLPVMPFDTEEEALEWANDSVYGLTASVWTRNRAHGEALARKLEVGTVTINDHGYSYGLVETPWHGEKESGIGVSHSDAGMREFLFPQHINYDNVPQLKRRMWWYPYGNEVFELFKGFAVAMSHMSHLPGFVGRVVKNRTWRKAVFGD